MEIQIHHIGSQNGSAMFEVIRSADMKRTAPVALPDPSTFPVEGHPAKQFFLNCAGIWKIICKPPLARSLNWQSVLWKPCGYGAL